MTRVKVAPQVEDFIKALAPHPRRALRQGVKALAQDKGETKRLEGKLSGYHRLRVGSFRVIYSETFIRGERLIQCLFCEERATVYDLFLKLQLEDFGSVGEERA